MVLYEITGLSASDWNMLATSPSNHFLRYSVCTIKIFPNTGLKPFGLTVGLGVGTPE